MYCFFIFLCLSLSFFVFIVEVFHILGQVNSKVFYDLWCYCEWEGVNNFSQCVCSWFIEKLLTFISWFCTLLRLFIVSLSFLVEFFGISICIPLISFSCFVTADSNAHGLVKGAEMNHSGGSFRKRCLFYCL